MENGWMDGEHWIESIDAISPEDGRYDKCTTPANSIDFPKNSKHPYSIVKL